MSRYLDTSFEAQMVKIMNQYGRSSRSSRKESARSSSGKTIVGKAIWESSIRTRLGKSFKLGMFVCQTSKRTIPIRVCGRYQTGRQSRKHGTDLENSEDVDLGEPTYFLDHVFFGCNERVCQISKDFVTNCRDMFVSRISAGAKEKLATTTSGKLGAETISWSYDMEGDAKKCVERFCELANKTSQQFFKVATPCMDDHQLKEEENESVGELSTVCSQSVLKMSVSGSYWETWYFWSVNKLARAVTKWTKSCDKRLARLISYIHHTSEYRQYCYVGNTSKQCRLGLFQDSDFAGDLEDSKSTSGCLVHYRKSHVCANQLDVQETNFSVTQLYRSWNHFSRRKLTHGRYSRSDSLGFGWLKYFIPYRTEEMVPRASHEETRRQLSSQTCITPSQWSTPTSLQQTLITIHQIQRILVPVLCCMSLRKWGSNQNDYQRSKSHKEACFTNPQSCSGLVVWQH